MVSLLERIRDALAPDLQVEHELGRGAMATVFLARDPALDRPVAVKVLRPEAATAIAEQRFLREAQLLARFRHPHVLSVHRAGTVDGLSYFVMDFAGGETLAARLAKGPIPPAEAARLTGQLLSALEAAHQLQIVHRDIKPANIFLDGDHALLGDFGIAHADSSDDAKASLTEGGRRLGTPAYMAPEQLAGQVATVATDQYALAMVVFEMSTARRWRTGLNPSTAEWDGVPQPLVSVLSRALAIAPEDRWGSVTAMSKAIAPAPRPFRLQWLAMVAVIGAVALVATLGGTDTLPSVATLVVGSFGEVSDEGTGQELQAAMHRTLAGIPYFLVAKDRTAGPGDMRVDGRVVRTGEAWSTDAWFEAPGSARTPLPSLTAASADALAAALANEVLLLVMRQDDPWLPRGALPTRPEGRALWGQAELHYAAGRWNEAAEAYLEAFRIDTTCILCSYRYDDVRRWLDRSADSVGLMRVRREIHRFPPHYRRLIAADTLPNPRRLDSLAAVVAGDYREFPLAWYRYGSELYNRGPLYGHDRLEARAVLEQAVRLRPAFHGPWYDLATLLIAEGDSAAAHAAVISLGALAVDGLARARRVFVNVAFAMRFGADSDRGLAEVGAALSDSSVLRLPEVAAGPRVLPAHGSPEGAMVLGRAYGALGAGGPLHYSGLIATVFGAAALGQWGAMEQSVAGLRSQFPASRVDRWGPNLRAVHLVFDDAPPESPAEVDRLLAEASSSPTPGVRWGAGWILAALRGRLDDQEGVKRALVLLADEPAPGARRRLATAWQLASQGRHSDAIRIAEAMLSDRELVEGEAYGDLFLRSGVMLSLAEWYTRRGQVEQARGVLRWHQHLNMTDFPVADPRSAEVDWSLGTLARWRAARLLDRGINDAELCRSYRVVTEHWAMGDPEFRSRADSARERLTVLACDPR